MNMNITDAHNVLRGLLNERKLSVFVGSGVSVPSGLPSWDGLLEQFVMFCEKYEGAFSIDTEFTDFMEDARKAIYVYPLTDPRQRQKTIAHPERIITSLKQEMKRLQEKYGVGLDKDLREWLTQLLKGDPNDMHKAIVSTNYSFLITSNYDTLLEKAARDLNYTLSLPSFSHHESADVKRLAAAIYDRKSCIIHAHGNLDAVMVDEIVFTAQDYVAFANKHGAFTLLLQTIFATQSILFLGYGASDPHFEYLLEELSTLFGLENNSKQYPRYFLVIKKDKVNKVIEKYKKTFSTGLIEVDDYSDYDIFLSNLQKSNPRPLP